MAEPKKPVKADITKIRGGKVVYRAIITQTPRPATKPAPKPAGK